MKEHIKDYKKNLEKTIGEYMERPVSERSAEVVKSMTDCWYCMDKAEKRMAGGGAEHELTHEDADEWNQLMLNADGTTGGHWTIEQTTGVAESIGLDFKHVTDWCWNVAMNMVYSDYALVAEKYGVDTAEFYADMAKAFLFDKDGGTPMEKLSKYYYGIVCKE